ncbi:hypothetical protein PHMEG_0003006 [Phytophthora megakarya]|uniref:Thioredoxin-like fold domain-containing protein n=1 Tax=Phytophthora megakarya TaxID=4795 RepID=A0A225WX32_9STRA|nr:hypothetical protein PHMEG_0003006 [Phytophthora megakarya]
MALLHGTKLVNAKGKTIDGGDVVKTRLLALRTGAQTAALSNRISTISTLKQMPRHQLDVVFLSSDISEDDQLTNLSTKHGDWWMVPRDADIRNELRRKYGIRNGKDDAEVGGTQRNSGIPALVLIRPDGEVIDFQGVEQVESDGSRRWSRGKLKPSERTTTSWDFIEFK